MKKKFYISLFVILSSFFPFLLIGQVPNNNLDSLFLTDQQAKPIIDEIYNDLVDFKLNLGLKKLENIKGVISEKSEYYDNWLYMMIYTLIELKKPQEALLFANELSKIEGFYKKYAIESTIYINKNLGNYKEAFELLKIYEQSLSLSEVDVDFNLAKLQLINILEGADKAYNFANEIITRCVEDNCLGMMNFYAGNTALLNGDFRIANDYYLSSINYLKETSKKSVYNNLTQANNRFDLEAAKMYSDSAFAIMSRITQDSFHVLKGIPYQNLAEYHAFKGDFTEAKKLIDIAIYSYFNGPSVIGTPHNYTIDLNLNKDPISLLDFLDVKIRIYALANSDELGDVYLYFDQVFQHMILDKFEDDNKFFQISSYYKVYVEAFHYFLSNQEFEKAYAFVQKLKDVVLLENIKSFNYENEIPSEYKDRYLKLKDSLQVLKALASDEIIDMKKRSDIRINIIELKAEIQKTHPEYFRKRFDGEEISISEVQAVLGDKHGLIDYFIEDSTLHIFEINSKDLTYHTTTIDSSFFSLLKACKQFIAKKPSTLKFEVHKYKNGLIQLEKLKSILLPTFVEKYSKITIVPNAGLNTLPFGALVDNISNSCPYIICAKDIHYSSSAKLLLYSMSNIINEENRIGIVAPHSSDINDPLYLPGAKREIDEIKKTFDAKRIDFETTDELFNQLETFNIHHFLSHAFIDMNNPNLSYISLGKNGIKLPLFEIVRKRIPSKMVNLSACNTGQGQYIEGEGVLSLSRAFLESGAKSIINTTHAVPDLSSSEIMQSFYQHLSKSNIKSHALALAKREYLKDKPLHQQHPYYWSGCIVQGDDSALVSTSVWNNNRIILLLISTLLVTFLSIKLFNRIHFSK